jgi:MoaA/NifB/PqqE/SkfB family radical SAM enzyme
VSRFIAPASGPGPEEILASELGEPFREYRRRWERAKGFREIPPYPIHVDYELASACNLRCPMCLFAAGDKPEGAVSGGKSLPARLVRELLSEGAARGQASMGFGGLWEPLLSPEVPALVEFGRSRGLTDAMASTNGLLLTRELSRDLVGAGLTRLMVSLDAATEATYALMRPGSDFGRVSDNVLEFLAARESAGKRLPLLRLSFCVTALNEAELGDFLRAWEGKADFFSIQRYGDFGAGKPIFPRDPPGPAPSGRCAQPFKRLSVRHDGTVLPCCDLSGLPLAVGNAAADGSLEGAWNGEAIRSIREAALRDDPDGLPGPCAVCRGKFGAGG